MSDNTVAPVVLNIDVSNIPYNTAPTNDPLPKGVYSVQIVEVKHKPTKAGTGLYAELELQVIDGPSKGRKVWDRLNVQNPNAQAVSIALEQVSSYGHALGRPFVATCDDFRGAYVDVELGLEAARGDNPAQNRVAKVFAYGTGGAQAAPQQAPAQMHPQQQVVPQVAYVQQPAPQQVAYVQQPQQQPQQVAYQPQQVPQQAPQQAVAYQQPQQQAVAYQQPQQAPQVAYQPQQAAQQPVAYQPPQQMPTQMSAPAPVQQPAQQVQQVQQPVQQAPAPQQAPAAMPQATSAMPWAQ